MKRRLLVAVAGISGLVFMLGSRPAVGHSHDHASHNQPGNPISIGISQNVDHVDADNTSTGGHAVVQGNRLYVGAYGLGFKIYNISDPAHPRLIGKYMPGLRADAVPDAAVFGGRHIAVLNGTRRTTFPDATRTDRSEFLDVTNPANPKVLHTFVGQDDGEAHNGDIVDARKLWLPSGGSGVGSDGQHRGLRIYDLRPLLASPARAPVKIFSGDPVKLWEASPYRRGRAVGNAFTHTHDITVYTNYPVRRPDGTYVKRDIALLAEGGNYLAGSNLGSVFIIDITKPTAPVVLLRWVHPSGPGHEQIRYTHEAQFLDGDRTVMLVTDEDLNEPCGSGGGVVAVRVAQNLTSAWELSEWFIPAGTPAPVCSVHVFSSKAKTAYFGSYNAGLQVVDYSRPRAPKRAGYYIAAGTTAWGALYHRGYVYVGDLSRGLDVFRFNPNG